MFVDIIKVIIL